MTYLDHNAGTPLFPEVAEFLAAAFRREPAGNPSSVHRAGRAARARLDEARARVARVVGRPAREVLFTASGSEACATAVLGIGRGGALVTSAIEHPCVLLAAQRRATPVLQVRPGPDGWVAPDAFEGAFASGEVAACALQVANNETGVVQPADAVAALARAHGVASFVDAVQAPGRLSPAFEADLVAYSAHKFGGPAGVGILAVRRGVQLEPLVPGHQEGGLRGGTPAVVLCEAAALALELAESRRQAEVARMTALRDGFERGLRTRRSSIRVHGAEAPRLANTTNVCFPGVDAETVLIALDLEGFAVSVGAACTSGTMRPSPVLLSMGVSEADARSSIRVSFGRDTTEGDVSALLRALDRVL
ncbi:MAG TPA: cysteine desulfurase family protein [Myxococcaceae bacterium]|nr:cysteine desulfurase family protein [Myxococcaceae bacterium]